MQGGRAAAWVGVGLWLAGCPGTDVPGVLDDGLGPGSSTGDRPGITTFNSTVDPTLPGEGDSMDAEGTTMGGLDGTTTATGSTTAPGSTTEAGGSSDSGTTEAGSASASSSSTTDPPPPACHDVPGNYEYCLDGAGAFDNAPCMAPGDATCLYTGTMGSPTGAVCSIQQCTDECDCPDAPATGNAGVACADVTGDPTNLLCHLDCSGGETCPTGMTCFGGFFCVWPGPGAGGTPYGNCFTDPNACGLEGLCLNNGAMPTIGVCTEDCNVIGDCPVAPAGGTAPVSCTDVTGDMAPECILSCSAGQSCPPGMSCFSNLLCVWD